MSAYAQISGNLGQNPELRQTNGGTPVLNLSLASNRVRKNKEGEKISIPDWFRSTTGSSGNVRTWTRMSSSAVISVRTGCWTWAVAPAGTWFSRPVIRPGSAGIQMGPRRGQLNLEQPTTDNQHRTSNDQRPASSVAGQHRHFDANN